MKRIFALSMGMLVLSGAPSMAGEHVGYKDVTMPDGFQTKVKWEAWQNITFGQIGQPYLKYYVRMPDGFWLLCANEVANLATPVDCTEVYKEYLPWHKKESE